MENLNFLAAETQSLYIVSIDPMTVVTTIISTVLLLAIFRFLLRLFKRKG
ncbi:MAG: hypothetical protein FWG44_01715 [Oscillospiraceae bacterium]|nr:hypothetical protein [Oscillospiraceae bacterium]